MRTKWSRTRAANQPSKSKTAKHNKGNENAARRILAAPEQHPAFMVTWATAFRKRRAEERSSQTFDGS